MRPANGGREAGGRWQGKGTQLRNMQKVLGNEDGQSSGEQHGGKGGEEGRQEGAWERMDGRDGEQGDL